MGGDYLKKSHERFPLLISMRREHASKGKVNAGDILMTWLWLGQSPEKKLLLYYSTIVCCTNLLLYDSLTKNAHKN